MRLGSYPCILRENTLAYKIYGEQKIDERHRHRFEFNNEYRADMEEKGFIVSGTSPDGLLVELVEVQGHPFMIGTQAHPEFRSRPLRPHPLFIAFIKASIH